MNENIEKIHLARKLLGLGGLAPFIVFSLCIFLDRKILNINPEFGFVSYSAIILSFLSGSLWGRTISYDGTKPSYWIILASNVFSLSAWFSLLIYPLTSNKITIGILLFGFISILLFEHQNKRILYGVKSKAYLSLRNRLSIIVVLSHLSLLFILK